MVSAQLNDVFSYLFFYFGQEKSRFSCTRIYFDRQHTLTAIEGNDTTPFLDFFARCLVKTKPKALKNLDD
jgi:hypothetical protein